MNDPKNGDSLYTRHDFYDTNDITGYCHVNIMPFVHVDGENKLDNAIRAVVINLSTYACNFFPNVRRHLLITYDARSPELKRIISAAVVGRDAIRRVPPKARFMHDIDYPMGTALGCVKPGDEMFDFINIALADTRQSPRKENYSFGRMAANIPTQRARPRRTRPGISGSYSNLPGFSQHVKPLIESITCLTNSETATCVKKIFTICDAAAEM